MVAQLTQTASHAFNRTIGGLRARRAAGKLVPSGIRVAFSPFVLSRIMLKRLLLVLALCSVPLAGAAPAVQASSVVNMIYQLDCVSQRVKSCGNRTGYLALWQMRFAIDAANDEDVAAWARLRPHDPGKKGANRNSSDPELLRTESFEASDVDDYVARLQPLLDPEEWERARRIIGRVRPAFDDWWDERAQAPLASHVVALRMAFESGGIAKELARMHTFFGVTEQTETELSVLLVRRVTYTPNSSAQVIGRYAVLEVDDDSSATQRMPVAVHEYAHFLFHQMPPARFEKLRDNILGLSGRHPSLERLGAWGLFNEALATAIGNGRVGRAVDPAEFAARMAMPFGLYNDANIDAAAKALLPILDRAFDSDGAIDAPSFANDYVTVLASSMGPALRAPRMTLQELAVLDDSSLADRDDTFVPAILKALPTNHSLWSYRLECCGQEFSHWWAFHAQQPRLAIVRVAQRSMAAALCGDVEPNDAGYSIRIVNGLPCIILAVSDASQIAQAVSRIAGMSELLPGDYSYIVVHQ